MRKTFLFLALCVSLFSCNIGEQERASGATSPNTTKQDTLRIVSINGTVTEVLCGLGLADNIVAVDVTSTYPEAIQSLPKTGHSRKISAETILSFHPNVVIGLTEGMPADLRAQLESAGVEIYSLDFDYSLAGSKQLITALGQHFDRAEQAQNMIATIDYDLQSVPKVATTPNVLFIYARGAGTLMVGGNHTAPASMIELAGGKNAAAYFEDFKPLTPEALVNTNPDAILMFDDGLESLGGIDGLESITGIKETKAGKNRKIIKMDGLLLTGFGPRIGKALAQLSTELNEISIQ